jgi:hypothetical protein
MLKDLTYPPSVKEVECLGWSSKLKYQYMEPTTSRSSLFSKFFDERQDVSVLWSELPASSWVKEFRPPSISDLERHLERFGGSRPVKQEVITRHLSTALQRMDIAEGTEGEVLMADWLTAGNLFRVRVPSGTSAGLRWKKKGMRTKCEALPGALEEALRDINGMRVGREYSTPPCFMAARGKLVDLFKEQGKKEGRLVVVPDLKRHLLGSLASVPYSLLVKNFEKNKGGVMIGMSNFHDWYGYLRTCIEGERKPKFYICADFSGYDQTVPRRILYESLKRISRRFSKDLGHSSYWRSEFKHLVDTEIVAPDGNVYVKRRGVASGDPWTSQVGSDANWLMHEILFLELGLDAAAWTFGDDVIVAVYDSPYSAKETSRLYEKTFFDVFGMEVKKSDTYVTSLLELRMGPPTAGDSVKFLSNYFVSTSIGTMPAPEFQTVVENMMYPEHNPESQDPPPDPGDVILWELARSVSCYLVGYWNEDVRNLMEMYGQWLRKQLGTDATFSPLYWANAMKEWDVPAYIISPKWLGDMPSYAEVLPLYRIGIGEGRLRAAAFQTRVLQHAKSPMPRQGDG